MKGRSSGSHHSSKSNLGSADRVSATSLHFPPIDFIVSSLTSPVAGAMTRRSTNPPFSKTRFTSESTRLHTGLSVTVAPAPADFSKAHNSTTTVISSTSSIIRFNAFLEFTVIRGRVSHQWRLRPFNSAGLSISRRTEYQNHPRREIRSRDARFRRASKQRIDRWQAPRHGRSPQLPH